MLETTKTRLFATTHQVSAEASCLIRNGLFLRPRRAVGRRRSEPQGIDNLRAAAGSGIMGAMPALTRRRRTDARREGWHIYYGDDRRQRDVRADEGPRLTGRGDKSRNARQSPSIASKPLSPSRSAGESLAMNADR